MAVAQWSKTDLETFIEYQQVMSEKEVRRHSASRDQVYEAYKELMQTKPGKELIKGHKNFIEQPKTIGSERGWLESNLPILVKETAEVKIAMRSQLPGADQKLIEAVKDHAAALTNPDKLHPFMRDPDRQQHALGVITHVSQMRKEKNMELDSILKQTTQKLTNLIGNIVTRNLATKELVVDMMDKAPMTQTKEIQVKPVSQQQDKGVTM